MAKPQRRPVLPPASMASLPSRAAEALESGRFKEAVELYRQLVRQEPRPEWQAALDDAYCGRARTLAAKQMFKEAAMVLENTRAPDGSLREPLLYATCLIREGQQPKAAAQLLQAVCGPALPAAERPRVEALLAALLTTVPLPPAAVTAEQPERARWREAAAAARQALTAWAEGAAAEEVERLLNRISLRSAFRPLRVLLKCLLAGPDAAERNQPLLQTIAPDSPFFPLRQAVEAALGPGFSADGWNRLTPPQRSFVAETGGIPAASVEAVGRLSDAAAGGPDALFAALLKRAGNKEPGLDRADLRSACFNLLPQVPDRIGQFEKLFGPLSALDRARVDAIAAEADGNRIVAERAWRRAAKAFADAGPGHVTNLSRAVICRHLAHLASGHTEFGGLEDGEDPVSALLARADEADPDHVPTVLARMARYRELKRDQDWNRLADEAARRFPHDSQVLLQATESAVARQAYKKAAGYARRLLAIDPINPGLRRQMVELQVSQARKQLQSGRTDLAARALDEAAQWERGDAPDAVLRLFRGLVALQDGNRETGEPLLRQGVDLLGGGVAGWFRAVLEADVVKAGGATSRWLREELAQARKAPPDKAAVQGVVSALGTPDSRNAKRTVTALLAGMQAWLLAAADLNWPLAEFQLLEDTLVRYDEFAVLQAMARAGRRREPGQRLWRFHEILARTANDCRRMTIDEADELNTIVRAASDVGDGHALARLRRYLQLNETMGSHAMLLDDGPDFDDLPDTVDPEALVQLLLEAKGPLPKDLERDLRAMVGDLGRTGATAALAETLAISPLGRAIPRPVARQLAEAMVKTALEGGRRPGRGGRF